MIKLLVIFFIIQLQIQGNTFHWELEKKIRTVLNLWKKSTKNVINNRKELGAIRKGHVDREKDIE